MSSRTPGEGRYAQLEREQRWLLARRPSDAADPVEIVDRYVTGTRLRLRRVVAAGETIYKLTQKVRADQGSPERVKLTNIYLSEREFFIVGALPASELSKTRWRHAFGESRVAADEFHGHLEGLVLAEIELAAEDALLPLLPGAVADVTFDDRFSGGALATNDPEVVLAAARDLVTPIHRRGGQL